MATKYWTVRISQLGASGSLYEGTVQATTWLAALQAGRAELGETAGLPSGASCNVAPNGIVTIQDSRQRRRYLLTPANQPMLGSVAPIAPPPSAAPPTAAAPPEPNVARPRRPSSVPPPPPAAALKQRKRPPRPSSPPTATVEGKLVMLASRDQKPTRKSPIRFYERMYAVPMTLHTGTAEKLATKLLRQAQHDIRAERGSKFVRIEVFDHVWRVVPERPPVVRIEWKDWQKTIEIDFPLEDNGTATQDPRIGTVPPPETQDRLAQAFEACQDLLFLRNRAEALHFGVHLLSDLLRSEACAGMLLDLNTDEFRLVAAEGAGAAARQGMALGSSAGLVGAAAALVGHSVMVLVDAPNDPRFNEDVDGVPDMDVRALLYRPLVHQGRLYGMLQLANGVTQPAFSEADCEIVDYVAEQLSTFVSRGSSWPPPSN